LTDDARDGRCHQQEDEQFGKGAPSDLPPELARAKDRLERLRKAKAAAK
jgi:hypothetical protein